MADVARETVERVHGLFAQKCPVYRSIHEAHDDDDDCRIPASVLH